MNKTAIASLIGLLFSPSIFAAEAINTDDVVVTANRFEHKDTEATYASEIHTSKMIEASGATTLYDYLAQQTSLTVLPNFGNKATPAIDMRGYGTENGFQNIVISVDGQRLNNIDLSPQLIGAIPLANIDRIEITKGSGSVLYGDGAMAGTIQIYTKTRTGVTAIVSGGNFGAQSGYISAGIAEQYFDLSASANHDSNDGYSKKDITGKRDEFTSNTQNVKLKIKPSDDLRLNIEGTSARIDTRYPNSLTRAQFRDDPSQNGKPAVPYTHQGLDTDQWRIGAEYQINQALKVSYFHTQEDKVSDFITSAYRRDYDYRSDNLSLAYQLEQFSLLGGLERFDGALDDSFNKLSKDNLAGFLSAEYNVDRLTISGGARREKVEYRNLPVGGSAVNGEHKLNAWDAGVNYRINTESSLFANYNQGYQTPDLDRSFVFDSVTFKPVFSGFIEPSFAKTFNLGFNNVNAKNRFKATAYRSNLHNEIYLVPTDFDPTFKNTNIDKSHKYGLELQDRFQITDALSSSLIYTYTRAIIDNENDGNGAFNGKKLPGVPKNSVVASLNYVFLENANLNLSHTWRSSTYSADDFANRFSQKQNSYESTNMAVSYRYKNLQWFGAINNIFEHKNSIQIKDDVIYPVDFSRTWKIGMRADF